MKNQMRGLANLIPVVGWLRPDLIAGLTAATVVIPKAMARATIAGLPGQVGLYTVFVPMAIHALLGISRPLTTGRRLPRSMSA